MVKKMLKTLSTQYRSSARLMSILEKTIQTRGRTEFIRLAQTCLDEPISDPEIIPSLSEFWNRTKAEALEFRARARKLIHRPGLVPNPELSQFALNAAFLSSGLIYGLILSQKDLKLFPSKQKMNAIFFHRPLVMGSELILNWSLSMLEHTQNHPEINEDDRQKIKWMSTQLHQFRKGLALGQYRKDLLIKFLRSARIVKSRKNVDLQVDPEFFSWLNYAISQNHD